MGCWGKAYSKCARSTKKKIQWQSQYPWVVGIVATGWRGPGDEVPCCCCYALYLCLGCAFSFSSLIFLIGTRWWWCRLLHRSDSPPLYQLSTVYQNEKQDQIMSIHGKYSLHLSHLIPKTRDGSSSFRPTATLTLRGFCRVRRSRPIGSVSEIH